MMREIIQSKLAAIKESQAANKAALADLLLDGDDAVRAEGRGPLDQDSSPAATVRTARSCGRRSDSRRNSPRKGRCAAAMMEKAKDDVEDVHGPGRGTVIGLYVPPDGQKMEQAFQAGNASLDRPGQGEAGLVFRNYAKPNDSMTLDFRMETKKLAALNVSSYLDDPSQPVALDVQFATLPDGTNYPATTVLNAPSKSIQVTMTNSNYQKIG